jgi:hypothetical protein
MRIFSTSLLILSGCMVFDESMRRHQENGSANAPAPDASIDAAPAVDAGSTSSSSGGTPADPAVCVLQVGPGHGVGQCGGKGGGSFPNVAETEPNDATAQSLTLGTGVCGGVGDQDEDRFTLSVASGCYEMIFGTDGAVADFTPPGAATQTLTTNQQLTFQAAAGVVDVTIHGKGHYRLLIR